MLKERLTNLFKQYDPAVRAVIVEIGEIEQRYISMKNPHGIMDDIDDVITRIAKKQIAPQENGESG